MPVRRETGARRFSRSLCTTAGCARLRRHGWGVSCGPRLGHQRVQGSTATFTALCYVVIDIGGQKGYELPSENLVSIVVRTELMEGVENAGNVLEVSWLQLDRPELWNLREHCVQ